MLPFVLTVVCAVAVAGLLAAERRDDQAMRWTFKPLASTAFVGIAIASGVESDIERLIVAGLVLSMLGDVFLIPRSGPWFAAGIAAFGLAHVAYGWAFAADGLAWTAAALAATVAMLAFGAVFLSRAWPRLGALRYAVAAYVVVISGMVALGAAHAAARADAIGALRIAGTVMFAISDIAVARDRFLAPSFGNRLWGLPLYYVAQCLLAFSV